MHLKSHGGKYFSTTTSNLYIIFQMCILYSKTLNLLSEALPFPKQKLFQATKLVTKVSSFYCQTSRPKQYYKLKVTVHCLCYNFEAQYWCLIPFFSKDVCCFFLIHIFLYKLFNCLLTVKIYVVKRKILHLGVL